MSKGAFDGSDRGYFFQEVRTSDEKTGTSWCPFRFVLYAICQDQIPSFDPIPPLKQIPCVKDSTAFPSATPQRPYTLDIYSDS